MLAEQVQTLQQALEALNDEFTDSMYAEQAQAAAVKQQHRAEKQQWEADLAAQDERIESLLSTMEVMSLESQGPKPELPEEGSPAQLRAKDQEIGTLSVKLEGLQDDLAAATNETFSEFYEDRIRALNEEVMTLQQTMLQNRAEKSQHKAEKQQWETELAELRQVKDKEIETWSRLYQGSAATLVEFEELRGESDQQERQQQLAVNLKRMEQEAESLTQALADESIGARHAEEACEYYKDQIRMLNEGVMSLQLSMLQHIGDLRTLGAPEESKEEAAPVAPPPPKPAAPVGVVSDDFFLKVLRSSSGESTEMSESLSAIQFELESRQLAKGIVK